MSSPNPQFSDPVVRSPRPGPVPVSIGARTRQLLPRDPQAIFNPTLTEDLVLANSQIIHSHIEIVNPPPPGGKRLEYQHPYGHGNGGLKKRRTTTREERLEALTFLENGREWYQDANGIPDYLLDVFLLFNI